jgi:hypothetical protein
VKQRGEGQLLKEEFAGDRWIYADQPEFDGEAILLHHGVEQE